MDWEGRLRAESAVGRLQGGDGKVPASSLLLPVTTRASSFTASTPAAPTPQASAPTSFNMSALTSALPQRSAKRDLLQVPCSSGGALGSGNETHSSNGLNDADADSDANDFEEDEDDDTPASPIRANPIPDRSALPLVDVSNMQEVKRGFVCMIPVGDGKEEGPTPMCMVYCETRMEMREHHGVVHGWTD